MLHATHCRSAARLLGSVTVLALGLAPLAASRSDAPLPKPEDVLHNVLVRVNNPAFRAASAQYRSVQHTSIEKLDEKGRVREREDRVYDVGPLGGGVYARLVQRNGRTLNPAELREEHEREQRFLEGGSRKFGGGDADRVPLDAELFERYKAEVTGRTVMAGRPTIILHFWPRSADLPIRRRQDYVLNKLTGQVWIDEQEWEIVKVEAHLTDRVRVMLGLVAVLDKVVLSFDQVRVAENVYLPSRLSATFDGRKLFTSIHERVQVDWAGQRPSMEITGSPLSAPGPGGGSKPRP